MKACKNAPIFFNLFLIAVSVISFNQDNTLAGKVTDSDSIQLVGVQVTIKGK